MKDNRTKHQDPLYTIFEKHLMNFQDPDIDRKTFINLVIQDYFAHLRGLKIVIPPALEKAIAEELMSQVQVMFFKKIYGCQSIQEFQKKTPKTTRSKAMLEYQKLTRIRVK